ncbi:anti-sigma factor [Litoribaculum gwangyangense]|uniref:Anti-sigma K factor RskA C-terminal domain-containing protein n=1 Tax=Litoribaculum gwangyangense TaxID=1130722 RepID=A0ABP9CUF1_9FLAO
MMMDKAYILKHGILEQYLLGELTNEEQLEVDNILKTDADLKKTFDTLEANFENLAFENAINPPAEVKTNLMQSIKTSQTKVLPLQNKNPFKRYLYVAASISAFLLISSIWMFTQLKKSNTQLKIASEQKEQLMKDIDGLKNNLNYATTYFNVINSPETKQYILTGNDLAPNAKVVSYVNHQDKSVIINAEQLPKLDDAHDYQMWADVDGVMIDMGVIDKNKSLLAMNYIENAESLNITIEPAGGNDHPTVSRLVTNVYL